MIRVTDALKMWGLSLSSLTQSGAWSKEQVVIQECQTAMIMTETCVGRDLHNRWSGTCDASKSPHTFHDESIVFTNIQEDGFL